MPRFLQSSLALLALLGLAGCYAPVVPVQAPYNGYAVQNSGYIVQSVQVEPEVRTVSVPVTQPSYDAFVSARVDVMIRKGPGKSYKGCGHLPKGHTAELLDCKGDWCKIRYQGQEGWSHQNYLKFYAKEAPTQVVTEQVVSPGYSVNYLVPSQPYYGYPQTPAYYQPVRTLLAPFSQPASYGRGWWEPR